MLLEKEKEPKKAKQKDNYSKIGQPLTTEEFVAMVKDADESGYLSIDEFKKKCQALLHSK